VEHLQASIKYYLLTPDTGEGSSCSLDPSHPLSIYWASMVKSPTRFCILQVIKTGGVGMVWKQG